MSERVIARCFRAIGIDEPIDLRGVLLEPFVLRCELHEIAFQLSLHVSAEASFVAFGGRY